MVPAPAHLGIIPTSHQSHISAHPLPAHLPAAFLQQGAAAAAAAQFAAINPSHATYLSQAGMLGNLPSAAAALGSSRPNRQATFPSYLYNTYD